MMSTTLQLSDPFGTVAYREVGQGEPLILIHGVGMQSAAWEPQIEVQSRTHRVIALDMPGHGGSDQLPDGAELPDYVAWLHSAVEGLKLRSVNLAGHSMGALISGGYTVMHPEKVTRVALLNGVYCRTAQARAAVEARAAEIREGAFDLDTPLNRWFGDSPTDRAARQQVSAWLSAVDPAGYAAAYSAFAKGDATYADGFADIACPLLALTGEDDPNSTPEMARAMAETARNGRTVVLQGHRHMVNLTDPQAVNAALRDWLQTPATRKETA
ncbi:MAG: alpha/beta fold hydrolase [Ruegeria sp.]|uniref:alpha/beta fold hydrolase n=1 Tax=Ruegeria sp. TaxID=1879320 RepID=UPI00349EF236